MNLTTDREVMAAIAPPVDSRWRELFAMPVWSDPSRAADGEVAEMLGHFHDLGLVVPFDWPGWYRPDRYLAGEGLASAPVADAVRLLTAYVRGDRFCDGALLGGATDGSIPAAIGSLWGWYLRATAGSVDFVERAEYSADRNYRWFYERRWAPGGVMCWVGLNPGTGDTDAGPRPTLRRVVSWAKREKCGAVVVVNLFSYRSTDPAALSAAHVDIVGDRTDNIIRKASCHGRVTFAAWGSNPVIKNRSAEVLGLLEDPRCVGVTKSGEPRHPLYVPVATELTPYRPS